MSAVQSSNTPASAAAPSAAVQPSPKKEADLLSRIPAELRILIFDMLGVEERTKVHAVNKENGALIENFFYGLSDKTAKALSKQYSEETRKHSAELVAEQEEYNRLSRCYIPHDYDCSRQDHSWVHGKQNDLRNEYTAKKNQLVPSGPAYEHAMNIKKITRRINDLFGSRKKFEALPVIVCSGEPRDVTDCIKPTEMTASIMRGVTGTGLFALEFFCIRAKNLGGESQQLQVQTFFQRYMNSEVWKNSPSTNPIFAFKGDLIKDMNNQKNQKILDLLKILITKKQVTFSDGTREFRYILA